MSKKAPRRTAPREHPTDKYAQSDMVRPDGDETRPQHVNEIDDVDLIEKASEDSFPNSDPPAYARGSRDHTTDRGESG
jgi:hypothetical protein